MAERKRAVPAHISIAHTLGTGIATGALPPGSVLPGEIELAARHGVSRSVIREAMRMLGSKRLIDSRPKAGTRVRPMADWNLLDPDLLEWMFAATPSSRFVRDLFDLRAVIEPAAAARAAANRSAAQLSRMGHAVELMALHGLGTPEGRAADELFHVALLEATGNALIVSLSSSISAAVRWTTHFKYRSHLPPRDPLPAHRTIFQAIADADADAARAATAELVAQALADTEAVLRLA